MNKKPAILLIAASSSAALMLGTLAATRLPRGLASVTADGSFIADATTFVLENETYVGSAVENSNNSVTTAVYGVTKVDDGLQLARDHYAYFTNVDPLRSISAVDFTYSASGETQSMIVGMLYFSSNPLDIDEIFAGAYSDLYVSALSVSPYSSSSSFELSKEEWNKYRYVLGLFEAVDIDLTFRSFKFTTPCDTEPLPAEKGAYTAWDKATKESMESVLGETIPSLGHNAYQAYPDRNSVQALIPNGELDALRSALVDAGYSANVHSSSGGYSFDYYQKRVGEGKVNSVGIQYSSASAFTQMSLMWTDTISWMVVSQGWPSDSLNRIFSNEFVSSLSPMEVDWSFTEATQEVDGVNGVSYLVQGYGEELLPTVDAWGQAMAQLGWKVNKSESDPSSSNRYFNLSLSYPGKPYWSAMFHYSESGQSSQASFNFTEYIHYDAYPSENVRAYLGFDAPDYEGSGDLFTFANGSLSIYGGDFEDVRTYLNGFLDKGFVLTESSSTSMTLIGLAHKMHISAYQNKDYVSVYFTKDYPDIQEASTLSSALYAICEKAGSGYGEWTYSAFPEGEPADHYLYYANYSKGFLFIPDMGQEAFDAWASALPKDEVSGLPILATVEGSSTFMAIGGVHVDENGATLTVNTAQALTSASVSQANAWIAKAVENYGGEDPIAIAETAEGGIVTNWDGLYFIDGSGDAALASLRESIAAKGLPYSSYENGYVDLEHHFFYRLDHNENLGVNATRLSVEHYPYDSLLEYVTRAELTPSVHDFVERFAALPDCGAVYLNNVENYGEENMELTVSTEFDLVSYAAALKENGFDAANSNRYFKETEDEFLSVRFESQGSPECTRITYNVYGNGVSFAEACASLPEDVKGMLPLEQAFTCYNVSSSEEGLSLFAGSGFDSMSFLAAAKALGWEGSGNADGYLKLSYLDLDKGLSYSLSTSSSGDGGYYFRLSWQTIELDFVPTYLGLIERGVNPGAARMADNILLPEDVTLGLAGCGYDNIELYVFGATLDGYRLLMEKAGFDVNKSSDSYFYARDKEHGIDYNVSLVADGALQLVINFRSEIRPTLTDADFAEYGASLGYDGVDFGIGELLVSDPYVEASEDGFTVYAECEKFDASTLSELGYTQTGEDPLAFQKIVDGHTYVINVMDSYLTLIYQD